MNVALALVAMARAASEPSNIGLIVIIRSIRFRSDPIRLIGVVSVVDGQHSKQARLTNSGRALEFLDPANWRSRRSSGQC